MIHTAWVFEERWDSAKCRTHDFGQLIKLAGMTDVLNGRLRAGAVAGDAFVSNWGIVLQWKVTTRYASKTETEAKDLFDAIAHKPDGVLRWLLKYW